MTYGVGDLLGVDVASESSEQIFPLGTEVGGSDGNTYMYVRANGAITAAQICAIDEAFDATPLTTTISGAKPTQCVVPQIAATDNYYLWAVVRGVEFDVKADANTSADVLVYTTATAGVVSDASTGHDLIAGLRTNAATATAAATVSATAVNGMATNMA